MVSHRYMMEERPRPSPLKRRFDQEVVPVVIDALAGVEGVLFRLGRGGGLVLLGGVLLAGLALTRTMTPRAVRRR